MAGETTTLPEPTEQARQTANVTATADNWIDLIKTRRKSGRHVVESTAGAELET